jgi:UDP-N-acetylglucosamine--N-acetylmuramyl-(pentapeptide) pyrophosphoryl-undecaprenol N-acetylglucosamine transferase
MMSTSAPKLRVVIACGGTGGHLFPGLSVAAQLLARDCSVTVLVSPKEVDQQAVKSASGVEVVTLPAVALQRGSRLAFLRGFWQSWRASGRLFKDSRPDAVLAMGGFTSAPPVLAARNCRARTFLHESNTIPGRANRWLAHLVDCAFVGFPQAEPRLAAREVVVTGTPVRPQFQPRDAAACRTALGLDPARPLILVMGGSQGATGLNQMVLDTLPTLVRHSLQWQWLHLTGPNDLERVTQTYARHGLKAVVRSFLLEMEVALGAATACISRAGASSLAELAAVQLPALLVPFPAAADNHQFHNARAFEETGAAQMLEQREATPEKVSNALRELVEDASERAHLKNALARWHAPQAAETVAENILRTIRLAAADGSAANLAAGPETKARTPLVTSTLA